MRDEIYPSRYGQWDPEIALARCEEVPSDPYDLVIIGTPPDTHVPLALKAIGERPRALLIEKPLSPPSLEGIGTLLKSVRDSGCRVFVGYDHAVGKAAELVTDLIVGGALGEIQTLDVEFREHWAGIFSAHPWLSGPEDTYLGYWERGGGAAAEHSHATNLWQRFALAAGAGRVSEVQATLDYVSAGKARYDRLCLLNLRTERGLAGRVVQDVVTLPARKWARIQGAAGAVEWVVGHAPGEDAVIVRRPGRADDVHVVKKTRPDDFIQELTHVASSVASGATSPIDLVYGVDTMRVIEAAHRSERTGQRVDVALEAPTEVVAQP